MTPEEEVNLYRQLEEILDKLRSRTNTDGLYAWMQQYRREIADRLFLGEKHRLEP